MDNSSHLYSQIINHAEWLASADDSLEKLPQEWLPWLEDKGSLTSALMDYSDGQFRVNVLSEHWGAPLGWEAQKLNIMGDKEARIREVELLCFNRVMVYARSIIPQSMYEAEAHTFAGMGSKPLGHLLFKDGRARNRKRSYAMYKDSKAHPRIIYGRSTPYEYQGGEILVSEFFVNPALITANK